MSGVLLHDGRVSGHRKWSKEAVSAGCASGIIVTPFSTPRVRRPSHPSAATLSEDMEKLGGEFFFDPMTHVRCLSTTNKLEFYDEWDLWRSGEPEFDSQLARVDHIERVFGRQEDLGCEYLAPTVQLSHPISPEADLALDLATTARGFQRGASQSLVATRQFWSSGPLLDGYVGSLAALRAPVWIITVANEVVLDGEPDMRDRDAFVGLCRTVRSLARRSRVILCYADYAGLPAVAAGADTIGTGWHRAQKTFDPKASAFHDDGDSGIRRAAEYVTQGKIHAILRRDTGELIARWNRIRADVIRGGPMPPSANAERMHHLEQLTSAVEEINATTAPVDRYHVLRQRYSLAADEFDDLTRHVLAVKARDKEVWNVAPAEVLEAYAAAEGF